MDNQESQGNQGRWSRFAGLCIALCILLLAAASGGGCEGGGSLLGEGESNTPVYVVAGQAVDRAQLQGRVSVEGVVSGEFLGADALDGFFIQGLDPAPDGKPAGIFVYAPQIEDRGADKVRDIEPGRVVRVVGRVSEFHGRPQLDQLEELQIKGEAPLVSHELAWPAENKWRFEGVHVTIQTDMVVTGNYELQRYGSLHLTPERRAFRPTNFAPGEGPIQPRLRGQRLVLDDGSYSWGPDPIPYLDDEGSRRVGSRVAELSGVLTYAFDQWRLHPVDSPRFDAANPRPEPLPPPAEGELRVAVLNADNYFLTLGERGAVDEQELELQRAKLVATAKYLNADILSLLEIENRPAAAEDFISRLSAATEQPWQLVRCAKNTGSSSSIMVAIAYRSDRVKQVTEAQCDSAEIHSRLPLLAGFRAVNGKAQASKPFAVVAIHFKSKSGCPQSGDIDRGQGCWNRLRSEQAAALNSFIGEWRATNSGIPVLIAGDLNAYGNEDPVQVLAETGKVDLLAEHIAWPQRYTYIFRGESGYLDHLQATRNLARRLSDVYVLPVNADEPYFLEYNNGGPQGRYRDESPFRSADHDPIAVDLYN